MSCPSVSVRELLHLELGSGKSRARTIPLIRVLFHMSWLLSLEEPLGSVTSKGKEEGPILGRTAERSPSNPQKPQSCRCTRATESGLAPGSLASCGSCRRRGARKLKI
jgi:hypothetical protein